MCIIVARMLLAIITLVILAAMASVVFQASLESGGEQVTIENETWTPDAGNVTTLDESSRSDAFYKNVTTVYNNDTSPPTEVDRGDDYVWIEENGTIKAVQGGALDGVSSALITYEYADVTNEQRQFAGLLGQIPRIIGLALPIMALIVLVRFIN